MWHNKEGLCSGIEVVITGLTRNQFERDLTRVRIPPAAPAQKSPPPFRFRLAAKTALWWGCLRFPPKSAALGFRRNLGRRSEVILYFENANRLERIICMRDYDRKKQAVKNAEASLRSEGPDVSTSGPSLHYEQLDKASYKIGTESGSSLCLVKKSGRCVPLGIRGGRTHDAGP